MPDERSARAFGSRAPRPDPSLQPVATAGHRRAEPWGAAARATIDRARLTSDTVAMSSPPAPAPPSQRLSPSEDPATGLHRVTMSELAFAFEQLAAVQWRTSEAIHQCRKSIKRLRALARLLRFGSGHHYRGIDKALRQAGRALGALRDEDVLAGTIERLNSTADAPALATRLSKGKSRRASRIGRALKRAHKSLSKTRMLLEATFDAGLALSYREIARGVEDEYHRMRESGGRYIEMPSPDAAHQLRKHCQRHLAHLRLLSPLAATSVSARIASMSGIAEKLGEHHDLAMLSSRLRTHRRKLPSAALKKFRRAAASRCDALDAELAPLVTQAIEIDPALLADQLVCDFSRKVLRIAPKPGTERLRNV